MKTSGRKYSITGDFKDKQLIALVSGVVCLLLISLLFPIRSFADDESGFDEISVYMHVQNIGGTEMPALIKDDKAFLSVTNVFDFLKIRNIVSSGSDSVSGFFINQKADFLIDKINNSIHYQGKTFTVNPDDLIKTGGDLYLNSDYFGQVFGLECTFNFRSLSVELKSASELPAIREGRLEQMRLNLSRLKGEFKADSTLRREYPFFHFGTADWAVNAMQQTNGRTYTRLNLNLGAILFGGEADAYLNYNAGLPFSEKLQYYLWRYANNDRRALRQVMVGKIPYRSISTIYEPVIGVQFTNAPTFQRSSFATYTLSNYTQPDWMVELYVNNILIDYVKADATGFFSFNVPLMYGSTDVQLRYYGPWGEEQTYNQNFFLPFDFLPPGEMQYNVTVGAVEDGRHSLFSNARVNYGVSRSITVGGGLEYLSSVSGSYMPFLNTSVRLASNLLFTGEYAYGIKSKGVLSYHSPSNFQMELYYLKYNDKQEAVKNNYTEEKKITVSMPFRFLHVQVFSKLIVSQNMLQSIMNNNIEFLLSGMAHGVNANITTYAYFTGNKNPYIYSNAVFSVMLPLGIILRPQILYEYTDLRILSANIGLEKHILRYGFINASCQENFGSRTGYYEVGFRYDFSFAHIGSSVHHSKYISTFSEFASGSFIYEPSTNYLHGLGNSNIGKGGIVCVPFLDINNNGKKDKNEPKVAGLNLKINGGRIEKNVKDTTIVVSGLEPYISYAVEFDGSGLDNIGWKLGKRSLNVVIDPNQLKLVEIPIEIVGEVSGMIYKNNSKEQSGFGNIKVCIYNSASALVACISSEADGYFSFLGLPPGSYSARIDSAQLNKLEMTTDPATRTFIIRETKEGDMVDDLEFVLQRKSAEEQEK